MSDASDQHVARSACTLLGATGSIGTSTIDLIKRNPHRYRVEAVSAHSNAAALAKLARELDARFAVVADPAAFKELKAALAGTSIEAGAGEARWSRPPSGRPNGCWRRSWARPG